MRSSNRGRWIVSISIVALLSAAVVRAQGSSEGAPPGPDQNEAEAPCDRHGLSTVFRCVFHDLRGVVNRDSLTWLAAGGVLAAGSVLLDDEIANTMMDQEGDALLALGDALGLAGVQFSVPMAIYVVARATDHPGPAALAITLIRTQSVNGILTRSLKLVPRLRPYQPLDRPARGSFPSGHTSATFATATVIQRRWGWRGGLPAYLVASYVGVTRLENEHYLSDVAFGAALGIASGLAVTMPSRRAAIAPLVAPGVTGVIVQIR